MEDSEKKPKFILIKMADRPAYLIAQLLSENHSEVTLYYPVLITIYHDDDGMQIVSSKYLPFAKDDLVAIVKTSIHAISTPKDKLIKFYLEFVKRWREEGLEKILEARILGERDPVPEQSIQTLSPEPPAKDEAIH